jgi:hypothetical protein
MTETDPYDLWKHVECDSEDDVEKLKFYVRRLFRFLDYTEESDSGNVFHPISFGCCRAMMIEPCNKMFEKLKELSK